MEHKAPLDAFDVMEQTPLHWAVLKNQQDAAIVLVKAGADLSIKNGDGQTPLDCASPEIKSLLEYSSSMAAEGPRDPTECAQEMFQSISVLHRGLILAMLLPAMRPRHFPEG